jgi:osmoprotectant transport system ATP-binding protein
MAETSVAFHGVWKRFDEPWVLRDVSLALPAGCTTAVVGESGSGKSTLLQLINAVYLPDRGHIEIFGEPIPRTELPAFRRSIGYAVQGAGLFPHMDVRANVTLLALLAGWPAADMEARYRELLGLMELDPDLGDRFPFQLSGGQQHRVGLCRALMLRPRLLLLDEPFSAIDPITRTAIHGEFRRVQAAEGTSTVLVTHDMREAVKLATYLVILRDGAVLQAGTTESVLSAPSDEYVARLLEEQLA